MEIEKRVLGRTGLEVTLLGLGAGGNSRLGLSLGLDVAHAASVVQAALALGITMFDTAHAYRTEEAVGKALRQASRTEVVVSSKHGCVDRDGVLLSASAFERGLDESLQALGIDTIDIYFIHGLRRQVYAAAVERFLPVLERARRAGKIRFFGVTEAFETDTHHEMLQRAVQDDCWDVVMVGFNFLNPSARKTVLPETQRKGIATLGMFAVRRALIDEERLRILLGRMAEAGTLDPALANEPDLMEALGLQGVCESLSEAAYRFCAFEPGLDCVLSGTSSPAHLAANLQAVARGPLPAQSLARLQALFGAVDSVSGQIR
jgi:L-galactose dehydrogenase